MNINHQNPMEESHSHDQDTQFNSFLNLLQPQQQPSGESGGGGGRDGGRDGGGGGGRGGETFDFSFGSDWSEMMQNDNFDFSKIMDQQQQQQQQQRGYDHGGSGNNNGGLGEYEKMIMTSGIVDLEEEKKGKKLGLYEQQQHGLVSDPMSMMMIDGEGDELMNLREGSAADFAELYDNAMLYSSSASSTSSTSSSSSSSSSSPGLIENPLQILDMLTSHENQEAFLDSFFREEARKNDAQPPQEQQTHQVRLFHDQNNTQYQPQQLAHDLHLLMAMNHPQFSMPQIQSLIALHAANNGYSNPMQPSPPIGVEQKMVAFGVRKQLVELFLSHVNSHKLLNRLTISDALQRTIESDMNRNISSSALSIPSSYGTAALCEAISPSHFLINTVLTAAFVRLGDRHHTQELLKKSLNTFDYLVGEPSWETAAAMVTMSIICILDKDHFQNAIMFSEIAMSMAEKLCSNKNDPLYIVTRTGSICSRTLRLLEELNLLSLSSHLIRDYTLDKPSMDNYSALSEKKSFEVTLSQIDKFVGPAEIELQEQRIEAAGYEDMACTALLFSYMLFVTLSRYTIDPRQRAKQCENIMVKLGVLEEYLCSASCPRNKQQRAFHKFATYTLRAEIFDRMGMHLMSSSWTEKALSLILDSAFLGWPPYSAFFFPVFIGTIARNQAWDNLRVAWERLDLLRREFHILAPFSEDVKKLLCSL